MNDLAEFRPLFLLTPLLRRWAWMAALAVVGGLAGVSSLVLDPARFESHAVLLPAKTGEGGGGDLFTLASRLGIGGGGGGGDISGIYDEVLRSISFTDRLSLRHFPIGWKGRNTTLEAQYRLPAPTDTLRHALALNGVLAGRKGLAWKVQPNGTVRLSFQSEDAVLSAAVVMAVMDELQKYTMEVRSKGTTQRLQVTMRNLDSISTDLQRAEERVASFQRANQALSPEIAVRLVRLEREARVLEQVYATLRQSKATLEVERDSYIPTFQVIETPRPALEPTFKPLKKWIPVGVVLGGMLGFLLVALIAWRKGEFRGALAAAGV